MKERIVILLMFLLSAAAARAETYQWTDGKGVRHFTDSLDSVPTRYRSKMTVSSDITVRNPKVQEDLRLQEQKAQQDASRPRIAPTPDYVPRLPVTKPVEPTEPPPRTKSQKIRDNIERRQLEEQKERLNGKTQP